MLAQLEKPTNDFLALARYLIEGRERPPNPDRVAWTIAENLPTADPLLAATYMTATAEQSKRCRNACYHTIIAWAKDEQPSPEMMQEIARKTLDLAGLGEHQALIMGHGDKAHAHLHMMINRVHPETGKAWATSHDYRRFDRIMRLLSEEYGFQYVPAHAFNPKLTEDLPKQPASGAHYAARKGADTARPQWSRSEARNIGGRLSERLDRAATWDDVEMAAAGEGLTLESKGQGMVVGNSRGYVKFSALRLTRTAKGFEKKFARSYASHRARRRPPTRRPWWAVDEIDIVRALSSVGVTDKDDVREVLQASVARRKARLAKVGLFRQIEAELKEALKATTSLKPATRRRTPVRPAKAQARHRDPRQRGG